MKKILFFLPIFLIAATVEAASFNPHENWKTIKTEHFSVHYPERIESVAVDGAKILEDVHASLSVKMNWKPWGRTEVLFTDSTDDSNALAAVLPYNLMIFRVVPPPPDSSLADYDDWLRMLITHEYTHLLHMDASRGIWKPLRFIFGKVVSPAGLNPMWVKEGYAVYNETVDTTEGRGRSSYGEMLVRSAVLEDNFPGIDRASNNHWRWPTYHVPYIFGGKFILYLVKTYGEDKFLEFNSRVQSSPLLAMVNHHAKKIYGKSFVKLWEEWQNQLGEEYSVLKGKLAEKKLTELLSVVSGKRDEQFDNPVLSPDSKSLAYSVETPHYTSEVQIENLETGKIKRLKKMKATGLAWSPDGKLLAYAMPGKYKTYSYYHDLWTYNLEKKSYVRLTTGERAKDPAFSPSGEEIFFVSGFGDLEAIRKVNVKTKEITTLTKEELRYTHFAAPRVSPDGKLIAVSAWKPGVEWKIYIYSIDGKEVKRLTKAQGKETSPWWSPDGKYIFYSSDETGISNIYRTNLKTGKTERITNVLTGVFEPTTTDGNRIYVKNYTSKGFEIASFEYGFSREFNLDIISKDSPHAAEIEQGDYSTKKYSPFGKALFLPRFISPYLAYLQGALYASFITGGSDPLRWHNWLAGVSYRTDASYLGYSGSYWYNRWWPIMGMGIINYAVDFGNDITFSTGKIIHYYEARRNTYAFFAVPVRGHNFSARYFYEDRSPAMGLTAAEETALRGVYNLGVFSGFQVGYAYGDYEKYAASISQENGRLIKLTTSVTDSVFGSGDRNEQVVFAGDWREYVRLYHHHVLGLRAAGGMTWRDELVQGTFGLGGDLGEGNLAQGGSTYYFPLRGLPVSAFSSTRAMLFSAEYRLPIISPQKGHGTWPFFLNNMHAAFFADYGSAWNAATDTGEWYDFFDDFMLGVGAELRGDFLIGYGLPVTGRLGYGIIVVNRDRFGTLDDPILKTSLKYGMLILQLGTSF